MKKICIFTFLILFQFTFLKAQSEIKIIETVAIKAKFSNKDNFNKKQDLENSQFKTICVSPVPKFNQHCYFVDDKFYSYQDFSKLLKKKGKPKKWVASIYSLDKNEILKKYNQTIEGNAIVIYTKKI